MKNLLKKMVYLKMAYLSGAMILGLTSFSAHADVAIGTANSDEITISNTQENIAYDLKIDEPQTEINPTGNPENLALAPVNEIKETVEVLNSVQVAVAETKATNLNGDLIAYIETIQTEIISIKSAYQEDGHTLVSTEIDAQPKQAVATQKILPFNREVLIAAKKTLIEPALIHAIISTESNYNPRAKSQKGAYGLMQIMPSTAKFYKVTDRGDPQQNITAGASLLRDLLRQFKGDIKLSLAAYNAGVPAVLKHKKKIPPYKETQRYVPKVLNTYKSLSAFI